MQPPSCPENPPAFAYHDFLSSSSSRRTSASVSASAMNKSQIFWDNRIHMYLDPDDCCTSAPRLYSCNYCQRKFYSSQALGGHQNAHKRERTSWASRRVPPATLPPSSSSKVLMRPLLPHANLVSLLGVNAGSFVRKQNHSHRSSFFSTAAPDMERSSSCSIPSSSSSTSSSYAASAFHLGIYRRLVDAENLLIWGGTPKSKAKAEAAAAVAVADHPKRRRHHSEAPFMDSSLHSADDEAPKGDADTSVDLSLRL